MKNTDDRTDGRRMVVVKEEGLQRELLGLGVFPGPAPSEPETRGVLAACLWPF
jgi:hypothetical protein